MVQFLVGDYSRPVPQPTEVPNSICVRCHGTDRYSENRLHIHRMFGDQERQSRSTPFIGCWWVAFVTAVARHTQAQRPEDGIWLTRSAGPSPTSK